MRARPRATAFVLLLAAAAIGAARRAGAVPVVAAEDAAAYVGSAATVEGDVASARVEPEGLVLELAPGGPKSVRAILVRALISSLPRSPERVYQGKRVRITGLLQRFQGRPEMVLESADQIAIIDVAGSATTSTTLTPAPATTSSTRQAAPAASAEPPAPAIVAAPPPPSAAPAPPPPARAVPSPPPAAPPVEAAAPPPPPTPSEPEPKPLLAERLAEQACERARARWADAAARARDAMAALTRCLDAGSFACRQTAAALAPVIGDLEWTEQQVADRCP